jgi:flagellar secretion chaperone FliS
MQSAAQAYLKTKVTTTSPAHIVLMLFDGAITALERSKEKIAARDYAQKGILISRAMDIIAELDGSLNGQKGGELAQNLHSLYVYCNTRLLAANMNMDSAIVDEIISILSELRSAFSQIMGQEGAIPPSQAMERQAR